VCEYLFFPLSQIRFVLILLCEQTTARFKISLMFTYFLSSQLVFLVIIKIYLTSKIPIARFARDSNFGKRPRRDGHAVATCLFTLMCHISTAAFITGFTVIPFYNRSYNITDHVVMTFGFIIKKFYSLIRLDLSVKNYVFTI